MLILEAAAVLLGFGAMVVASRHAIDAATELAAGSRIPPFVIGLTLLAMGTDLPEFANSIASSVTGHGDVNVGDSVGSAATQMTLVLGLLPIIAGPIKATDRGLALTGTLTVLALALVAGLAADGDVTRGDSLMLLTLWIGGSILIHRRSLEHHQPPLPMRRPGRGKLLLRMLAAFLVLAGGAATALWGVIGISERFGVPEFLIGFFVAAIGTSLPELVFDLTALRRGQVAMALGDVLGSSFVDATASVAIGPLVAPIDVTSDVVLEGTIAAMVAIAAVTLILARITTHDWRTGSLLIGIYGCMFIVLVGAGPL